MANRNSHNRKEKMSVAISCPLCKAAHDLDVCKKFLKKWRYLFPKAIQDLQSQLTAKKCQIPRPKSMLNKPHLHKISEIIMPLNKVLEVGLLLFNIKMHVQKLLGEKDFICENNRNLNSTWEFKMCHLFGGKIYFPTFFLCTSWLRFKLNKHRNAIKGTCIFVLINHSDKNCSTQLKQKYFCSYF